MTKSRKSTPPTNIDLKFYLIRRDLTPGDNRNKQGNATYMLSVYFLTHWHKISNIKLSEARMLLGGDSTDYRKLQDYAESQIDYSGSPPQLDVTIPVSQFVAWAKVFGNSQALPFIKPIP
tara:strand:- start:296 stop:655 length:360 start_codon:yes stop_codon:yes gene_type:complete